MRDKVIDQTIKILKTIGRNNLLFGTFLIAEGLSLIFARAVFPVFVTLSILIAYAFALEWLVGVLRGERTFWNICQRVIIIIILIALLIYCGFIIFDESFRINVDRVIVSLTTIVDGTTNLLQSVKIEKRQAFRRILVGFSAACIIYGVIYGIVGGAEANIFTTTLHGIVFILCGFTNLWLYIRSSHEVAEVK
ncbi:hypothetical protein IJ103_01620 [Candidatus Saccharibacteria bacterium]|nr:hypothetical protein [Candidatus Saccharibacteria bacterium]